jgi:DNA repair exonuclease SbcCD nuclease subunit
MIRFLHTSDWQLGMTRHFLSEGAQERYSQARVDAIRAMGRVAKDQDCQFMLVCGDAFESNLVDRKTVARALEALKEVPVPVFILPGNHDPLNPASVYRSGTFIERKPEHVRIIDNPIPIKISEGIELVGAPWTSKRPVANPIEDVLSSLHPTEGVIRVCMAHGCIDLFTPDHDAPGLMAAASLQKAIDEGKVHFIALGDRHSLTKVGGDDRIWYSGTPEATDFSETQSGYALIVEIGDSGVSTRAVQVGQWRFIERDRVNLDGAEDVESLRASLEAIERKEMTVLRLRLVGTLSLSLHGVLKGHLDAAEDVFGGLDVREDDLLVMPDDADFADLSCSGFADATLKRLRAQIENGGEEGLLARDALMLLLRLARGQA